jgi:hypothetical protein
VHIYLAGTEGSITHELLEQKGVHRGFASYYYIKLYRDLGITRLALLRQSAETVIIDSGAHTFFAMSEYVPSAHSQKSQKKIKESPEEYMRLYLDFLIEHSDKYDYFVELDIGEIIGQKQVYAWRRLLERNGLIDRAIIVYHPATEALKKFVSIMRDWPSGYVALQGYRSGRPSMNYVEVIKHCYDAGVKVHGFAMTKTDVLNTLPFYSVDSSTFLAGAQFGRINLKHSHSKWTGVQFCRPRNEAHKEEMSRLAVTNSVALDTIEKYRDKDERKKVRTTVLRHAANSYAEMEEFYTRLWKARGVDWDKVA